VTDSRLKAELRFLSKAEKAYFDARRPMPQPPKSEVEDVANEDWFKAFMAKRKAGPSPEWTAYEAAHEAWIQGDERLRVATGLAAAEKRVEEADRAVLALRDKIAAESATTLAEPKFKARYALDHFPGSADKRVMAAILSDIVAM